MHTLSIKGACAVAMLVACALSSGGAQARLMEASYAEVASQTSAPYGWYDFCGRQPKECAVPRRAAVDIAMTDETWETLDRINRQVNASIKPVSNFDHWGTRLDHWDYPIDGKGDCKIYALYKRKLLLDGGFPRQALLMTIVRDLHGDGHAILTVKTDHGEFVLDNLASEIRPWNATGYRFVKRQSQEDPNLWVAINDPGMPALTLAREAETFERHVLDLVSTDSAIEESFRLLETSLRTFWNGAAKSVIDARIGAATRVARL